MIMKKTILFAGLALCLFSCKQKTTTEVAGVNDFLTDSLATQATVALYQKLDSLLNVGIMVGHQDDLAYGHGWYNEAGRSDVHDVTGQYPAVFGWEIGHIELGTSHNIDSIHFDNMRNHIREVYAMGAINTISWHGDNIVTGGSAWDVNADLSTVQAILPGGSHHEQFLQRLDKVADFFLSLTDENGILIPVIFRMYHEHNGSWFWWGRSSCLETEYKLLWTMTVEHLRDTRGVHNLLYAYSPASVQTEQEYIDRYPGDKYVDMVGFDCYANGENASRDPEAVKEQLAKYQEVMTTNLNVVAQFAAEHHKIPTISETGMEGIADPTFFTQTVYPIIQDYQMSYILFWRNAPDRLSHFYVPYPNNPAAADFKAFVEEPKILTAEKLGK
jgi:mannan endo-1,4-beta-mannosidase